MEVTLWISYTLLCVHRSAFVTRGSRGPAHLAMALERDPTCTKQTVPHLSPPCSKNSMGATCHIGLGTSTSHLYSTGQAYSRPGPQGILSHPPVPAMFPWKVSRFQITPESDWATHLASWVTPSSCPVEVLSNSQPPSSSMNCTTS